VTNLTVGDVYAVSTGTYLGEFFVLMKSDKKNNYFLSLPKMINRTIDHVKVKRAIETGILEFQENLPEHIMKVCKEQYKQTK